MSYKKTVPASNLFIQNIVLKCLMGSHVKECQLGSYTAYKVGKTFFSKQGILWVME
jgi:hypothetical protein